MDNLDNRVVNLENRVGQMETTNAVLQESLKYLNRVVAKLDDTLDSFQVMFTELKINSGNNAKSIANLEGIAKKNEEDKNLNVVKFIKDNWVTIGLLLFLIAQHFGLI